MKSRFASLHGASPQSPMATMGEGWARVIYALGMRHVGEHTSRVLAEHFPTLDGLSSASLVALRGIHGIGPTVAHAIVTFFSNEQNRLLVKKLIAGGVSFPRST